MQKDASEIARHVLDPVVPDAEPKPGNPAKNPAAVALGRLGGLKGGKGASREALRKRKPQ